MCRFLFKVIAATVLATTGFAAQFAAQGPQKATASDLDPRLGEARTETWRIGMIVTADSGACVDVLILLPVPKDWPEQAVTVVGEEKSQHVKRLEYKSLGGGVKQMRVTIPNLPSGAEAKALLTVKVRKHAISEPPDTKELTLPAKLPANLKDFVSPSPYIESGDAKIQSLAKEIVSGKEGAWQRAEAIYDWVRANVEYRESPKIKGARKALDDRTGDCEELTALFIALCRANKIPARTVWVPGHCYPEFYLVDKSGQGYWIPCQAAGGRAFGSINEYRPILQKGDSFRMPEKPREPEHYATLLVSKRAQPTVKLVHEKVAAGSSANAKQP